MITEQDLFCMGMESETADKLMPQLCEALGYEYPPSNMPPVNEKRERMEDPLAIH